MHVRFIAGLIACTLGLMLAVYLSAPRFIEMVNGFTEAGTDNKLAFLSLILGIPISLAGTVFAIMLAYSALRTTNIQTTLITIGEFSEEMEQFVTGHDRLCASFDRVMAAARETARTAQTLRESYDDLLAAESQKIGPSGMVYADRDEALSAFLATFVRHDSARQALCAADQAICAALDSAGGYFWESADRANRLRLQTWLKQRAGRYAGHAVHAGLLSATEGRAPFQACALTDGEGPALCFGALADPPFSPYEDDSRLSNEGGLRSANRTALTLDFDAHAESMARFLPCDFPSSTDQSMQDYPTALYRLTVLRHRRADLNTAKLDDMLFPQAEIAPQSMQFALKLPVYLGMIDPAPALAAMRDHFIEIGCDRRVVELTIRSRKAKMAFFRSRLDSLLPRAHR